MKHPRRSASTQRYARSPRVRLLAFGHHFCGHAEPLAAAALVGSRVQRLSLRAVLDRGVADPAVQERDVSEEPHVHIQQREVVGATA
jgi:hypothetical protein